MERCGYRGELSTSVRVLLSRRLCGCVLATAGADFCEGATLSEFVCVCWQQMVSVSDL